MAVRWSLQLLAALVLVADPSANAVHGRASAATTASGAIFLMLGSSWSLALRALERATASEVGRLRTAAGWSVRGATQSSAAGGAAGAASVAGSPPAAPDL